MSPFIVRTRASRDAERSRTRTSRTRRSGGCSAKGYMDSFINPPEFLEAQQKKTEEEAQEAEAQFPEHPQRDVLQFLIEHAPLERWQRDVLEIIREEAYYFAPQGRRRS